MALKSDKFSHILNSIGASSTVAGITTNISVLRQTIKEKLPTTAAADELELQTNLLEIEVSKLKQQLQGVSELLDLYEQDADKQLPEMIENADAFIVDYRSAYDCSVMYDTDWFSRLLMSIDAKVEFATALYGFISRYTTSNTETLKSIMNRDPLTISFIEFPSNLTDQYGKVKS